ncbi:hypothetical protein UlMin_013470 [Ulmus minor]
MEAGNNVGQNSGTTSGGPPASSRWSPTKEQVNLLETLYGQGIRTPSAEQIQEITTRLRAFGHIEGKNVFYWFQNHKARQRQKQKQESLAYINSFIHRPTLPIFPYSNVVCGPYYLPVQTTDHHIAFQPQYNQKLPLPSGVKKKPRSDKLERSINYSAGPGYEAAPLPYTVDFGSCSFGGDEDCEKTTVTSKETLSLFPLNPEGNLQERNDRSFDSAENNPTVASCTPSSSSEIEDHHQPFYDFFSGESGSCESYN